MMIGKEDFPRLIFHNIYQRGREFVLSRTSIFQLLQHFSISPFSDGLRSTTQLRDEGFAVVIPGETTLAGIARFYGAVDRCAGVGFSLLLLLLWLNT